MNPALATATTLALMRALVDLDLTLKIDHDYRFGAESAWHVQASNGAGATGEDLLEAVQRVLKASVEMQEYAA